MNIQQLLASHQGPDIISSLSLSLWSESNPKLRCYTSWLWESFIPHFGGDNTTFVAIPDRGMQINLGRLSLDVVPAHFLHSAGNFHLYDGCAKIYFSGDVGAAFLPQGEDVLFDEDFDKHIRFAEGFHARWMGSSSAKRDWCERVSVLEIDQLCPQHGAIYTAENVSRFINWFDELKVGVLAT